MAQKVYFICILLPLLPLLHKPNVQASSDFFFLATFASEYFFGYCTKLLVVLSFRVYMLMLDI